MKATPRKMLLALGIATACVAAHAERVFYMPMELKNGQVAETVGGRHFDVQTANEAQSIAGAKGRALRLDGYSNFIDAEIACGQLSKMTFSLWCAMETWPIIEHDVQNETEVTMIAGNYDADAKKGFGFFVSRVGKYSFRFFSGGWPMEITAPEVLPLYQWNNLVVVADGSRAYFYNNGTMLGAANCRTLDATGKFLVGKCAQSRYFDLFFTNTINGIIDEIEIYNENLPIATISAWRADNDPELNVVADELASNMLRPAFHAMPSRNWTNETHGLLRHNGQYHLFFQKNANGPYMSRLQWGHLVSNDMCSWTEWPIAIGSDQWFDLKGCWSGCVVVDDAVTGGKPNIIYTGVDYARAMISQAAPADNDLLHWTKNGAPIIDGRPEGLSDDFRDPYFFRSGNDAYIIVGTSKDGKGACTLHKFDPSSRRWSNDGRIFFAANSAASQGSFWEMPNVTPMGDKWLFTATPLGMSGGVKVIYWTGTINADGTFATTGWPDNVELPGFAKEGYGLLSPSIMQVDGQTIALGIVPDKLPSEKNYTMGWAHTFSLPRQWSLDDRGRLVQKPWSGLEALRQDVLFSSGTRTLSGTLSLGRAPMRQAEILGEFVVGDKEFGFSFFKNGNDQARLTYNPSNNNLTLDFTRLSRMVNDGGVFDGRYVTRIPVAPARGETMKIQLFIDRSIIDIFINDRYASSVRVFPTGADADGLEAFTAGSTEIKSLAAWSLRSSGQAGIDDIEISGDAQADALVDVYSMQGVCLRSRVARSEATAGLEPGIYIVGGAKVLVR